MKYSYKSVIKQPIWITCEKSENNDPNNNNNENITCNPIRICEKLNLKTLESKIKIRNNLNKYIDRNKIGKLSFPDGGRFYNKETAIEILKDVYYSRFSNQDDNIIYFKMHKFHLNGENIIVYYPVKCNIKKTKITFKVKTIDIFIKKIYKNFMNQKIPSSVYFNSPKNSLLGYSEWKFYKEKENWVFELLYSD